MIMLFSSRPSTLNLIGSAIILAVYIIFLHQHVWVIVGKGLGNAFHETTQNCVPQSVPEDNSTAPANSASVTLTATHTPAPPSASSIPEKLWYKIGPKGQSDESREWAEDCLKKNPSYRVEYLRDGSDESFVKNHYAYRPDIIETYLAIQIPILKADFLRYLILYAKGGIWSDLDVSCADVPIHEWVPTEYKKDTSLVVGLEFDWAWENDNFIHSQFASWTIMAKPGSKHMMVVIDDILERLRKESERFQVKIADLSYDKIGLVVDLTGPKGMTRSLVKSLEMTLNTTIDDRNISGLLEPKLFDDILILPGNSFAPSQNGYPKNQGPVLVFHHYAGTWKNDRGGEGP